MQSEELFRLDSVNVDLLSALVLSASLVVELAISQRAGQFPHLPALAICLSLLVDAVQVHSILQFSRHHAGFKQSGIREMTSSSFAFRNFHYICKLVFL